MPFFSPQHLTHQYLTGCGSTRCLNPHCRSSRYFTGATTATAVTAAACAGELLRNNTSKLFCYEYTADARHIDLCGVTDRDLLAASFGHFLESQSPKRAIAFFDLANCEGTRWQHLLQRGRRVLRLLAGAVGAGTVVEGLASTMMAAGVVPSEGNWMLQGFIMQLSIDDPDSDNYQTLLNALCSSLPTTPPPNAHGTAPAPPPGLVASWSHAETVDARRCIAGCHHALSVILLARERPCNLSSGEVAEVARVCTCLQAVWLAANDPLTTLYETLPDDVFYCDAVNECVDLSSELSRYLRREPFFLRWPFLLSVEMKVKCMHMEARALQSQAAGAFAGPPKLKLRLTRNDRLVSQVLDAVASTAAEVRRSGAANPSNPFRRPLMVEFVDEVAIDAGGPTRELFSILGEKLFSPEFSDLFVLGADGCTIDFAPTAADSARMYQLCGCVMGLAVFNRVLLAAPLPRWVFHRLRGRTPVLKDLKTCDLSLYTALKTLLQYDPCKAALEAGVPAGEVAGAGAEGPEGYRVEDVFCLNFTADRADKGGVTTVELCPGGATRDVTLANRQEFAELMLQCRVGSGVDRQFRPFRDGFLLVCQTNSLELLSPAELEQSIVGSTCYDWRALEASSKVEDNEVGYCKDDPQVRWLWEIVLDEFSEAQKRQFLMFVTGADRAPVGGLGRVKITVSRNGKTNLLPTTHTCFSILDLPPYETKEELKEKLTLAIENCKGFGFV